MERAQGYFDLGLYEEAWRELDDLDAGARISPPRDVPPDGNPAYDRTVGQAETAAEAFTMLTLPTKLDTLKGDRAANQRLGKACYWLHVSGDPEEVIEAAIADTPRGQLVKEALRRNLKILHGLGCLGEENLAKLRRGRSPIIPRGPYAGEPAKVDHIVPVVVAPEFSNWIGNLEFMPRTLNRRKGAKIGCRLRLERSWQI